MSSIQELRERFQQESQAVDKNKLFKRAITCAKPLPEGFWEQLHLVMQPEAQMHSVLGENGGQYSRGTIRAQGNGIIPGAL